jgi:aspartate ammonia-lyase
MTVGQELHAFAASLDSEVANLRTAERALYAVNMGGTAIGTGLNAPKAFPERAAAELAKLTGKPIVPAADLIAATWDLHGFAVYSSALNVLAAKLAKIAGDLILLSSGPRAGLNELTLPPLQPGSSIMPGKVNPVMPELLGLVSFRVMANDLAVTLAAKTGQLQLNAYEPLVGVAVLESQGLLTHTLAAVRERCVEGIRVNERVLARHIEETVGIVTALNPLIGYERASELAGEAYASGKGILELIREKKVLTEEQIQELLDPAKLTGLDESRYPKTK